MKKLFVIWLCLVMLCTACQSTGKENTEPKEFNILDYVDAEESAVRKVLEENGYTIEEMDWSGGLTTKSWKVTGTYQEQEFRGALIFYAKEGQNCLAEMELQYRTDGNQPAFVKQYFEDCIAWYGDPEGWNNVWDNDPETDEAAMAQDYLDHIEERFSEPVNMTWYYTYEGFDSPYDIRTHVSVTYPFTMGAESDVEGILFVDVVTDNMIEYDGVKEQLEEMKNNR